MTIGNYVHFLSTPVSVPVKTQVAAPAPVEPRLPAPVRRVDEKFAADCLSAMGLNAISAASAPPPKLNPFIGFRSNMAKLREAGVVSVPRVHPARA